MNIENFLAKDFSMLVDRLKADDFAERTLAALKRVERLRLVAVAGAGAVGAGLAASQFGALTKAVAETAPFLAELSIEGGALTFSAGPVLMTTLLFAVAGGATAMILPGAR
ncbi:MAG: hypothetical protein ACOZAA_08210 [Pseudomonadota bacterium]